MDGVIEKLRLQSMDWGVELDPTQLSLLGEYADLLAGYELANVVGTKSRHKIVLEHLLDALSCYVVEDLCRGDSLIDVGTGGGLPGIPLGIARPELHVTLLEAVGKKASFLENARVKLGLPNLEVLHARAEDAGRKLGYKENFDIVVARALAALPVVVEYCAPFVRMGGTILAMKGQLPEEELTNGIAASRKLGVELRDVREVKYRTQLPQKERRLVVLDKVQETPDMFPRRVGLAKKRPLGI